jgi:hypothetical protein
MRALRASLLPIALPRHIFHGNPAKTATTRRAVPRLRSVRFGRADMPFCPGGRHRMPINSVFLESTQLRKLKNWQK